MGDLPRKCLGIKASLLRNTLWAMYLYPIFNSAGIGLSCDSLVRVCFKISAKSLWFPVITLKFSVAISTYDWIHLAEVVVEIVPLTLMVMV